MILFFPPKSLEKCYETEEKKKDLSNHAHFQSRKYKILDSSLKKTYR